MDRVHVIRHKVLIEGQSIRRVARELGVSRVTVKKYLSVAEPRRVEYGPRARPVSERIGPVIDSILEEWSGRTTAKQRVTASRVRRELLERGYTAGPTTVKRYLAERRRKAAEVFVPLVYRPGELAEVDFFEIVVEVAGEKKKAWKFLMRLMASGKDFAWIYERCDQVSFLDGHVRAFEHLGGVPRRIAYDNLTAAVKRRVGAVRELSGRFLALVSHYLFEPCFARPATGHDKGGVEARGKGVRWQHLVPIPKGNSLEEISRMLLARLDAEAAQKQDNTGRNILERFAEEKALMLPLPEKPFEPAEVRHLTPTRRALVQVDGGLYSVWSTWAKLPVTVHIGVNEVAIVGPDTARVIHPRVGFGGKSVDYRHYLPELARKPQALRQVAHELLPKLREVYARAWTHLVDVHGPKQAARVFAQVLKAVVVHGETTIASRLELALAQGESMQLAVSPPPAQPPGISLDALPAALRDVAVASASAADFDALLRGAA